MTFLLVVARLTLAARPRVEAAWPLSAMAPSAQEQAFLQTLPSIPRDAVPSRLFKRVDKVGQGAYGSVYKAEHAPTSFVLALKIIDLDTQDDDTAEIQHEVGMLQSMTRNGDADRNNVSRYFGCWLEGPKVWIAMDYADGGSVRTLVRRTLFLASLPLLHDVLELIRALAGLLVTCNRERQDRSRRSFSC